MSYMHVYNLYGTCRRSRDDLCIHFYPAYGWSMLLSTVQPAEESQHLKDKGQKGLE